MLRTTFARLLAATALALAGCSGDSAPPAPVPTGDGLRLLRAALGTAIKEPAGRYVETWSMPGTSGQTLVATWDRERLVHEYRFDTVDANGRPAPMRQVAGVRPPLVVLLINDEYGLRPAATTAGAWIPVDGDELPFRTPRDASDSAVPMLAELRGAITSKAAIPAGPGRFRIDAVARQLARLAPSEHTLATALVPLDRVRALGGQPVPVTIELDRDGRLVRVMADLSAYLRELQSAMAAAGHGTPDPGATWTYDGRFEALEPPLALPSSFGAG